MAGALNNPVQPIAGVRERTALAAAIAHVGRASLLALAIIASLRSPKTWLAATLAEMRRQTLGALPLVIMLCLLGGALMSQQTGVQFQGNLPNWVVGEIVAASLITEMVPLFVGFALVGIVGARITAEIGAMQITEQVDALEVIGRDPVPFLVVPRVLAGLFAGPVLTVAGLVVSMLAGWGLAVIVTPVSSAEFWFGVTTWSRDFHYAYAILKGIVFGGAITFVGCYVGFEAGGGSVGVGRATTAAVVAMISAVVALDTLMVPLLKLVAPMITVENLHCSLGGVSVLRGVTLHVDRGEVVALVGPSGTGKSVLLKHIIGLLSPMAGTIRVAGESVGDVDYRRLVRLRRRMGYVFQDGALLDWLTVRENLRLVLDDSEIAANPACAERRVEAAAARVNLPDRALEKRPAELSGGLRKRAGVARAIVHDPAIILYDEPTTGLDPQNVAAINDAILRIREEIGATSIVVTHDMASVAGIADRVVLLIDGRTAFDGPRDEFFISADPVVRSFIACDLAAPSRSAPPRRPSNRLPLPHEADLA